VIQACQQPGVSIAAIALANGLNANMLRKWVIDSEGSNPAAATEHHQIAAGAQFIALPAPAASVQREIRIEVQRGETAIKVSWPTEAASECASWMRELLK
jgi:transposase-like protein